MPASAFSWVADAFYGVEAQETGPEGTGATPEAKAQDFVAFDLETTGLDASKEHIVEIGAVRFEKRGIVGRFSVLVNPGVPMPEAASKVNGISDAMLEGAPLIGEVMGDFLRFIKGCVLVAHNATFDCGFVNAELARLTAAAKKREADQGQGSLLDGEEEAESPVAAATYAPPFSSLPNRIVDTLPYAKEAFPGRWKYSLQELASFLNIQAKDAHRAEDDARVCMELFVKCIEGLNPLRGNPSAASDSGA